MEDITSKLRNLGLSKTESCVYIAVTELGEANATDVAKKAGVPRTTAISVLAKLEEQHFISIQKYRGRNVYWVESPKMLAKAFETKVKIATDLSEQLADMYRSEADFPFAKVYDSPQSIKAFIEKSLHDLPDKAQIYTIDNPRAGNYMKILSEDFYYAMLDIKSAKGITTQSLINGGMKGIDEKKLTRQSIEIRSLPKSIDFKASFWIMGDMLVLFSGKRPFVVAVQHAIITHSMKSIFDFLWYESR